MTRDEHRARCLDAMYAAFISCRGQVISMSDAGYVTKEPLLNDRLAAAFDALPTAGARVNPIKATVEMMRSGDDSGYTGDDAEAAAVYEAMSAAGDLTNHPEEKL